MNEHFIEFCGWAGSTLATLKYIPQAYKSYVTGRSRGIQRLTIKMWFVSLILIMTYAYGIKAWAILATCHVSLLCWCVIAKFKFFPRNDAPPKI